jgi:hypothetical protein
MAIFGHVTLKDMAVSIRNILYLLQRPIWRNPATGAVRLVDVVTTISTVTSITNIVGFGGVPAEYCLMMFPMKTYWQENVRARIN